jgi:hypothetical protein
LTKVRRRQKPVDFATLETYFQAFELTLEPTDLTAPEASLQAEPSTPWQNQAPRGPLPLGSPFYVFRPPVERLCFQEILSAGALVRVKAPRQFGKTSLITQILGYAQDQGFSVAVVNLQLVGHGILEQPETLLRWFCASVARALGLPNELADRWDDVFGPAYSCTDYFESYLLSQSDRPLLLVIDGFDELFSFTGVATDFCGLLRAWYEQGRYGTALDIWQRLRLVIAHSMESWLPLILNQSPFNVGLPIELPCFDDHQIQEMASRYELDFSEADATQLQQLLGGHPYLTQMGLFHLSQGVSIADIAASATAYGGLFSSHLRRQLELLEASPELPRAMAQVVKTEQGARLHPREAFQLQGLGLVRFAAQQVIPSCNLYRDYFSTILEI